MGERLKTIEEYYENLEYGNNKEEALREISTLTREMNITNVNNFSERFRMAASIIEKNLSLFKSACEHVDVITTIMEYLNHFSVKLMFGDEYDEDYLKNEAILLGLVTILVLCEEVEMRLFLEKAIINNSLLDWKSRSVIGLRPDCVARDWSRRFLLHDEMILLGDTDLHAVISYFRKRKSILASVNKIWVQESLKENFFWFMREYFGNFCDGCDISMFRARNELFTASIPDKINIVSIWTEDVVFAKNLAMHYISLNRDVLFINTHMDFYGGIVLLPYSKQNELLYNLHSTNSDLIRQSTATLDKCAEKPSVQKSVIYNFFYDGMWQRPVKSTYWVHNDSQLANATSDDVNRCIKSAREGFKTWSAQSVANRMKILSKFASVLECHGKFALAEIISPWIKFSSVYESSLFYSQSVGLEVTKIRSPKGVIVFKEKDETVLFRQLTQALTVGNSVIVICDTNLCSLTPYCNMFSTSGIPPGVINFLSSETLNELELILCGMDYVYCAKFHFSENSLEKTYRKLTRPKQIILPLK